MRIQNTTNSIANAICRFCVKGLSVSCISLRLQSQSWHLLPLGRLMQLSLREWSRVNSHVMGMLRNLIAAAARMASDMDANVERCLQAYQFALSPCAVPVSKPATHEARMGKPASGSLGTSYRNLRQVR